MVNFRRGFEMLELASNHGKVPAETGTETSPLVIRGLTVSYGQKPAVFSVDMTVQPGAMTVSRPILTLSSMMT